MKRITTALAIPLLTLAAAAPAGPLVPPAGSVAPTMKTLQEVEPRTVINGVNTPGDSDSTFVIAQPGAYYLAESFGIASGKTGISVTASNVTIDLNGYTITGYAGSKSAIVVEGQTVRVSVRNGIIINPKIDGIDLIAPQVSTPQSSVVENVIVRGAARHGIRIVDGEVLGCKVHTSGDDAILAYSSSGTIHPVHVERCIVTDAAKVGIQIERGSIRDCTLTGIGEHAIFLHYGRVENCYVDGAMGGVWADDRVAVTDSTFRNTRNGVTVGVGSVVRNNSIGWADRNGEAVGITCQNWGGTRVEGNNITGCGIAIRCAAANNLVIGNSIWNTTTAVSAVPGNRVGTMVSAPASGAINGNTGGGLGTTDPHANILY